MNTTPFNIHKITLFSFEPEKTATQIKKLFGKDIEKQKIPDIALRQRKAKWFQFKEGARSEIHIIKPFQLKYNTVLRKIDHEQKVTNPLFFALFENHAGIYVPNLTEIVNRLAIHNSKVDKLQKKNKTIKSKRRNKQTRKIRDAKDKLGKIEYILFKREDGLNQLYVDLHGSVDYLEIDSYNYDYTKTVNKLEPIRFRPKLSKQLKQLKQLRE
jgi:hypothetical protein